LKELSKSNNEYFLIIGADNILDFKKWKEPKEILKLCKLIVTNRGGMDIKIPNSILGHKIYIVQIPNLEISSSTVRRLVREGKSIKYLVPEKVENFILSNKLYREK
ncbi:MAG: nicotinate-nicotinamide nucleotide adenylyltransferase, partial [Ignavibacteria bacterium]|nr:nicotinate-nicotinamide nucleotide adenylyltransferase [Ignavibacteria bacterium]